MNSENITAEDYYLFNVYVYVVGNFCNAFVNEGTVYDVMAAILYLQNRTMYKPANVNLIKKEKLTVLIGLHAIKETFHSCYAC